MEVWNAPRAETGRPRFLTVLYSTVLYYSLAGGPGQADSCCLDAMSSGQRER